MSSSVYQTAQRVRPIWHEAVGNVGTIDVGALLHEVWRFEHTAFIRRIEAIEEREAVRFWHAAETEGERSRVERLYGTALDRWRARCKAARGDAERFAPAEGGGIHA